MLVLGLFGALLVGGTAATALRCSNPYRGVGGDLLSFDSETGQRSWSAAVDGSSYGKPELVDDGVAVLSVVGKQEGQLRVVNRSDGSERWRVGFDGVLSPVEVQQVGEVIVLRSRSAVTAFDAHTGDVRWTTTTDSTVAAAGTHAVLRRGGAVVGIDTASGQDAWAVPSNGDPLVRGKYLLVVDGSSSGPAITSLDPETGVVRWTLSDLHADRSAAADGAGAAEVTALLVGRMAAGINPEQGNAVWSIDVGEGVATVAQSSTAVLVARGTGGHAPGELLSVDPATGRIRWRAPYEDTDQPAVDDRYAYLGRSAIDTMTGEERWVVPAQGFVWVHGNPSVGAGSVAFAIGDSTDSATNQLVVVDKASGAVLWRQGVPHPTLSPASGDAGRTFVTSTTTATFCGGS